MLGNARTVLVSWILLAAGSVLGAAHAQAPKSKPAPKVEPLPDSDATNAPEALRGKSVIVTYTEIRTARPDGGGPASTRRVPYQLVVYISTQKRAFNRLTVASAGSSDQVRGKDSTGAPAPAADRTGYAQRTVSFNGPKMSVSNSFGGGKGFREITATFNESFSKCTGNVTTTVQGGFARQTKMGGGQEELLSAKNEDFTCNVQDGNALGG